MLAIGLNYRSHLASNAAQARPESEQPEPFIKTASSVIGPDDEILVYYGAADTVIGVAKGKLRDIVPVLDDL